MRAITTSNHIKVCNCHSYNAEIGITPEVKLSMLLSISPEGEHTYKDVMVDACIAPVIKHLWDNGIATISSCCGHNGQIGSPSIVLSEGMDNYSRIRELIKEKDNRYFELTQWKRVIV